MIDFRVLGSLEVVDGDRPLSLGPPRQRALLALLLIHRGEPVSLDLLLDALWGERVPSSGVKIVQGYVSNLRKVLGEGLLFTRGRGYLLETEDGQVDVDRFEALLAEGRRALTDNDPVVASGRLRDALGRASHVLSLALLGTAPLKDSPGTLGRRRQGSRSDLGDPSQNASPGFCVGACLMPPGAGTIDPHAWRRQACRATGLHPARPA